MKASSLAPRRAGFTLIELMVVITIIALLFSLVVGGYTFADRYSKNSFTERTMAAIKLGLENYKTDFGEYPEPANPGDTVSVAKKTFDVSGGAMLYQALSGDGFNQIRLRVALKGKADSDGTIDQEEAANVKFTDMPKEVWTNHEGKYYMVDGFGHPYQYVKAVLTDPTTTTGTDTVVTVNRDSYDLWSYGADEENTTAKSIDTVGDETLKKASVKWIKNW